MCTWHRSVLVRVLQMLCWLLLRTQICLLLKVRRHTASIQKEAWGTLISTKKELEYAITTEKPMFLIKMCDEFLEDVAKLHLHAGIAYKEWNPTVGELQYPRN